MNQSAKYNWNVQDVIMDVFIYSVLIIFTLLCFYPFYYVIINTISSNALSQRGEIIFWPREIHFANYAQVFNMPGLMQAAFISVARTVVGTVTMVIVSAFLGFMFTQEKMWLRLVWYRIIIITMYFSAGLIPWYLLMLRLGLVNNFLAYIIPGLVAPFNIILVKTYVESTPKALQESAQIDGASVVAVFFHIVLPIIKPILATIAVFGAVAQWNALFDTLILMTDHRLYTLQFLLFQYINNAAAIATQLQGGVMGDGILDVITRQTETSVRMTITIIVTAPILFVYPFLQKYFVQGIMIGAIKG